MMFLFATDGNSVLVPLLIGIGAIVLLLLVFLIVLLLPRRRERRTRRRIHISAMQESVRPERRKERESNADSAEKVAIIAAALAVATENSPGKSFRVVSFRRTR